MMRSSVAFRVFLAMVLGGFITAAFAAPPQGQKPPATQGTSAPAPAQPAEGSSLATKPCPRAIADDWDNCNGVTEFQNGDRYVGNFRKGLPDGIGTYYWKNGREYFGEFKRGLPNGKGKFTDMSNSVYIGDFVDGRMAGKATVDYKNGAKYVGDYKDDRKNGKGTYTYSNGDKYTGDFVDDEMTPNGVLELANGDRYVGTFKALKPQGKGTYTFKDGRKFTGDFQAGEPQGQGTLVSPDGVTIASGAFNGWDNLRPADSAKDDSAATAVTSASPDTQKVVTLSPAPQAEQSVAPGAVASAPSSAQQQPVPQTTASETPKVEKPKVTISTPPKQAAIASGTDEKFPVHCRFKSGFWYDAIICDVVEDIADIKDVVFNRGKCPNASQGYADLKASHEQDGGNITLVFRSSLLNIEDFRGPRKFGDRIEIPVMGCPNLLEYAVEANGVTRTWKTYQTQQ